MTFDLPGPFRRHLEEWIAGARAPAFLALDGDGRVREAGGDLARYGLAGLRPGDRAADRVAVLEGAEAPLRLECVELESGASADLHVFAGEDGANVLFLDVGGEARRLQAVQQRGNELDLLRRELDRERRRADELLGSILPESIAARMKAGETGIAEMFDEATILFADIQGFATLTRDRAPTEVVGLLDEIFTAFDALAARHGVEKIKTIADAYMCAAGLPAKNPRHAHVCAEIALDMQETIARFSAAGGATLHLRIGMHSGPVVAGVIGASRMQYDLWGETVGIASQAEAFGVPGAIQVTGATHRHLKDAYLFDERGEFYIKGVGDVTLHFLRGRRPGR